MAAGLAVPRNMGFSVQRTEISEIGLRQLLGKNCFPVSQLPRLDHRERESLRPHRFCPFENERVSITQRQFECFPTRLGFAPLNPARRPHPTGAVGGLGRESNC